MIFKKKRKNKMQTNFVMVNSSLNCFCYIQRVSFQLMMTSFSLFFIYQRGVNWILWFLNKNLVPIIGIDINLIKHFKFNLFEDLIGWWWSGYKSVLDVFIVTNLWILNYFVELYKIDIKSFVNICLTSEGYVE